MLAVTLCCVAFVLMSVAFEWIEIVPSYYVQSAILLALCTIIIYRYLERVQSPSTFVQIYLLSMAVKLLAYGAYVAFMVMGDKPGANRNVLFFLVLYVALTTVEVLFLRRKIARNRPH